MDSKKTSESNGTSCPIGSNSDSIVIVKEGQLCPVCGFAKLVKEPGNIIRCPVCGYGSTSRNT